MSPGGDNGLDIRWRWHLIALGLYAALSVTLIDHGASLTKNILGTTSDPLAYIWFLSWWFHAISHHVNPLFTASVWAPEGVNMAWTNCVPALAVLMLPVMWLSGPVLAFNLLTMLAPLLSALAAYALCLYVTRQPLAAVIGGFCFGFSTYEMVEVMADLNLNFNAPVPCMLLVVLMRLDNRLGRFTAAGWFALLLSLEFYIAMEVAATALFIGGLSWFLALALVPARRKVLWRLLGDGIVACTAILILPVLWNIITVPRTIIIPQGWSYMFAARLGNLVVHTPRSVFAMPDMGYGMVSWIGRIPQYDFTTGALLLLILGQYGWTNWRYPATRWQVVMLGVVVAASLGPQLWIGNHFSTVVLPWRMMLAVPLLNAALPVRLALFSCLIIAVLVARWVALGSRMRACIALFAWALTVAPPHPVTPAPYSTFFRPHRVEAILGPAARILILPSDDQDRSSFWQAENQFGFTQVQGYLGMPPVQALAYTAVRDMIENPNSPELGPEIAAFCQDTGARYVIAGPGTRPAWIAQMRALSWKTRTVDDVLIFDVPVPES